MLKYATINRPSRGQQHSQDIEQQLTGNKDSLSDAKNVNQECNLVCSSKLPLQQQHQMLQARSKNQYLPSSSSVSSLDSPTLSNINSESPLPPSPALFTTLPLSLKQLQQPQAQMQDIHSRMSSSSLITDGIVTLPRPNITKNVASKKTAIKIYAHNLIQDIEYVTLQVDAQTKCRKVIKNLLQKFRLKHRDANLFYLTLDRWIRKDGLRQKSVMLLSDDACPVQLQQCCSNPPHNDIKFTLQTKPGVLIKIHCSEVHQDAKYKCLSLSTQTTVEETIELILHCLNLNTSKSITDSPVKDSFYKLNNSSNRHANSPNSTCSSISSGSSSSSSGFNSDLCFQNNTQNSIIDNCDLESRASSSASMSSNFDDSSLSSSLIDQYCLVAECKQINMEKMLDNEEYLVDLYQSLLEKSQKLVSHQTNSNGNSSCIDEKKILDDSGVPIFVDNSTLDSITSNCNNKCKFKIKLTKRLAIKDSDSSDMEVCALGSSSTSTLTKYLSTNTSVAKQQHAFFSELSLFDAERLAAARRKLYVSGAASINDESRQKRENFKLPSIKYDTIDGKPMIPPRRRNLPTISTFGKPNPLSSRRHYDQIQLAHDLEQLNHESSD